VAFVLEKVMLWKTYAIVFALLSGYGLQDYATHASRHSPLEWAVTIVTATLGTAGVYSYAFKFRYLPPKSWRSIFFIDLGANLLQYVLWIVAAADVAKHISLASSVGAAVFAVCLTAPVLLAIYRNSVPVESKLPA
jgi:hypothetical protein